MPGMLSSLFDTVQGTDLDLHANPDASAGDGDDGSSAGSADSGGSYASDSGSGGSDAGHGSGEGYGTAGENSVGTDLGLGLDVRVGFETGGTYETPDGTSHSWTDAQEVNLNADADALLSATNGYEAEHFGSL